MKKIVVMAVLLFCFGSCEKQSPSSRQINNRHTQTQSQSHTQSATNANRSKNTNSETVAGCSSKVRMKENNGVYTVPIKINGLELNFIFDSGASDITISSAEAIVLLKQGKLKEEDVLGQAYYQIADGSISAGTIINLRTVQIANKVLHNVQATVIDNIETPLLLGQSALSRFGKISVDYNNMTIEFQ